MSRFKPYPKYKDSGVEWLGEVPEGWKVTALKRGFSVTLGKMLQPDKKNADDKYLPYLRAANVQLSGVDTTDVRKMWFSVNEQQSLELAFGDLLISEGGDVGRAAIWQGLGTFFFQNSLNRVRANRSNNNLYLYYWMLVVKHKGYIDVLCNKSTIAHFTAEKVSAIPVPFPALVEQTQIARFLDHETARIDALIQEQQRLIELLKEKRQAVISHAVTKGLDPTVPMKDSGVEWLGKVPAHWEVKKLSFLTTRIGSGKTPKGGAESYALEGILFIRSQNVYDEGLRLEDCVYIDEQTDIEMAWSRVKPLDVLLNITGASIGRSCIVPASFPLANVNQHVCEIRLDSPDQYAEWVALTFKSKVAKLQVDLSQNGAAREGLNFEQLSKFVLCLPPQDERLRIMQKVAQSTEGVDYLITTASTTISLLQERRSALISAAVTGKIDVREWHAPEATSS